MGASTSPLFSVPLVCVDIETDGMNHVRGHVLEVAALRIENGEITDEFSTLLDIGEVPYFITRLTGITSGDIAGAPVFADVADRLLEIMDGAIFVAHNARFDYSFLKQEFKRIGVDFEPKQLCTVKLSRKLYPDVTGHKLSNVIERFGFSYSSRHRAYDDAHVLYQFLSHIHDTLDHAAIDTAVRVQLRRPSIPKQLDEDQINALPSGPGIYIFEDNLGNPLYIGKSVNIRRRVLSHFTRDSEEYRELRMSEAVHNISYQRTGGELEALLLESQLIKQRQPLYNRLLRRKRDLIAIRMTNTDDGYVTTFTEPAGVITPERYNDTLALYPNRSTAKKSLLAAIKTFDLCPKLMGVENGRGACFSYQLGKCRGACAGRESVERYNARVLSAFQHKTIDPWPYRSAMLVQEQSTDADAPRRGFIVDQWQIIGTMTQDEGCEPSVETYAGTFDYDAYKIVRAFIVNRAPGISVTPYAAT